MLALATGWTPNVIGSVPDQFRRACHWALYVRLLVGDDGLPEIGRPPRGATPSQLAEVARMTTALGAIRAAIYPGDADG